MSPSSTQPRPGPKQTCLIVGASHAAAQLAPSLRQQGWTGGITLIGDEARWPYQRPPLSKAFLAGDKDAQSLAIRSPEFYAKQGIEPCWGQVCSIDRQAQMVALSDGRQLAYDKLALCTGASELRLNLPGHQLKGVHYLRSLAQVEGIRQQLASARRVVIIGGGYIGLETAASLRKLGLEVRVLEAAKRLLQRVTAPAVASFYARIHREAGVQIHTDTTVVAFEGDDRVRHVLCSDGQSFAADMVIIGVGVRPNTALAATAGLAVEDGVVVDEYCQTSDPNIVAAGDCAKQWNPRYGKSLRLESVPNAMEQAKAAAASICGNKLAQQSLPWFWSDQYELKLQIAGLNSGYDQVVLRGDHQSGRSFSAFYLRQGQLLAADCINRPADFVATKALLNRGCSPDPADLVIEERPLKALLDPA